MTASYLVPRCGVLLIALGLVPSVMAQPGGNAAPAPTHVSQQAAASRFGLSAQERSQAVEMMQRARSYLKSKQDQATGGWNVNSQGPVFPAITGLVVNGLLLTPGVTEVDQSVALAHKFMLNYVKDDGGIYDKGVLPSYNTAICVSALSKFSDPRSKEAVKNGANFLKKLQNGEDASLDRSAVQDAGEKVGKDHPFYGGWGYGSHGRPDLSNTGFALEALHAAGVESSDPAFQRALVFLQRVQMVEKLDGKVVNDMSYAKGSTQGGFVYATSENKDKVGSGESKSAMIEETMDDGTKVSRLRAYGSMTYAGFKSYLYAGLSKNDPRVVAARQWMRTHYTISENPGVGTDGQYYYYVTFARALSASGEPTIEVVGTDQKVESKRWAADLVNQLATMQEPDGSFKSVDDRWMESDPVLITAYSLIALGEAVK
jgi:squalene-hopene/tetraprenyl-beta-curcumene cyclase